MSKPLEYLGIARMSGNLELGEENAKALVKAGKARALQTAIPEEIYAQLTAQMEAGHGA